MIFADPKILEASFKKLMFSITAEFTQILSAPANNIDLISFMLLTPPPTDKGIKTSLAVLVINFERLFVP